MSDAMHPRCASEDNANDQDFNTLTSKTKVKILSGLREVHCYADSLKHVSLDSAKEKFGQNVKRFEAYLRPILTRPRDGPCKNHTHARLDCPGRYGRTSRSSIPLYYGSQARTELPTLGSRGSGGKATGEEVNHEALVLGGRRVSGHEAYRLAARRRTRIGVPASSE